MDAKMNVGIAVSNREWRTDLTWRKVKKALEAAGHRVDVIATGNGQASFPGCGLVIDKANIDEIAFDLGVADIPIEKPGLAPSDDPPELEPDEAPIAESDEGAGEEPELADEDDGPVDEEPASDEHAEAAPGPAAESADPVT